MKKLSLVLASVLAGTIAQGQLIDDFSSGSLVAYTKSVVLEQDGTNAISFASPSGTLQVSKSTGTTAEQVLFLRNDFSLDVGKTLRVDALNPVSGAYGDFGIAVSALVDPLDAVWTSGTADVRQNYINVYLKHSTSAVGYVGFSGTANIASSSGVFPPSFGAVTGLYISRLDFDKFDVGYTTASGDTLLKSFTGMNTGIGAAVGFYADLRAVTSYSDLDNLRITVVPEPASAALLGLGSLAFWFRVRRK